MDDPVEAIVEAGLKSAGIRYERHDTTHPNLDFYLTDLEIWVEVKQFHSTRTADQMARVNNIIAIVGRPAAKAFVKMITKGECVMTELERLELVLRRLRDSMTGIGAMSKRSLLDDIVRELTTENNKVQAEKIGQK